MKKRIIFSLCALVMASALITSVSNTWKWAGDFYSLTILLSIPDEDRSWNPYSQDFFWLSQDQALSLIKTSDYPFKRCSQVSLILGGCEQPKIKFATILFDFVDAGTEPKVMELIQFLIDRGEPLNAYGNDGVTALHTAILVNHAEAIKLLLQHGADPTLTVQSNSDAKGKNAFEYLAYLIEKDPAKYAGLQGVLD